MKGETLGSDHVGSALHHRPSVTLYALRISGAMKGVRLSGWGPLGSALPPQSKSDPIHHGGQGGVCCVCLEKQIYKTRA